MNRLRPNVCGIVCLLVLVVGAAAPKSAIACTATIAAQKTDGGVAYQVHAQATCDPGWWNYVYVYSNHDDGAWGYLTGVKGTALDFNSGFGTVCESEGMHKIGVLANCTVDSSCPVPEPVATDYATYQVKWDLSFGLTYVGTDSFNVHFKRNSDSGNSVANPAALPWIRLTGLPSGRAIGDLWIPNNLEGDVGLLGRTPPAGDSAVLVQSIACGTKVTQEEVVAPICPNCPKWQGLPGGGASSGGSCPSGSCSNDPVNFWTGAVEYSERDPLPDSLGFLSTRWYNNQVGNGWFVKWRSLFDARAGFAAATDYVSITLPTGMPFIFRKSGASYVQMWPREGMPASLTKDSSYRFRMAGDLALWSFSAEDGTLQEIHDVTSGRGYRVSWLAGVPATVEDLRGNWILDVTASAASHRIDGIAVRGTSLSVGYGYNGSELQTVSAGGKLWRRYVYSNGNLSQVKDAADRLLETHDYDGARAINSHGPGDEISSIAYRTGRVAGEMATQVTYASGATATYYLRTIGNSDVKPVEIAGSCSSCSDNSVMAWDADGNLIRQQNNRGYITQRVFASGKLMAVTEALRPAGCDPATASDLCRLSVEALAAANLEATEATTTTTYAYDDPRWPDFVTSRTRTSVQAGKTSSTTTAYDASGNVTATSTTGWTGPTAQETRATTRTFYTGIEPAAFNPGGSFDSAWVQLPQPVLPKSVDGPRSDLSDVTTYVYYPVDPIVPAVLRGRLAATRNAAGQISRFESYDAFGNVLRQVDPNGVASELIYDQLGRVTSTTIRGITGCDTAIDPLCSTDLTTTRTYENVTGPLVTESRANGVSTYEYDGRSRVAAINRGPSAADLRERLEYTYDPASGKKSSERYLARRSGQWVETRRESYAYDGDRRLSNITHPDSTTVIYTYDPAGAVASVKDERHTTANTFYTYDPAGRLSSVNQSLATAAGGAITTSYGYDRAGNLASVTDPNGNTTTYVYDDFGQMLTQSSPVTGTTTYGYDAGGNLLTSTDANGATTARAYDALNRVTSSTSSSPSQPAEAVTYSYDSPGAFAIGRLTSMSDPTGSTSYRYERRGLLALEQKTVDSASYSTSYFYDADGNRTGITYPSGRKVTYDVDYAGRQVASRTGGTTLVSSAQYLPFGPLTDLVFGNGTTRAMRFDSRYFPLSNALTGPAGAIASYAYTTDPGGNITSIHDSLDPSFNRDFGYDDLNRLTTANSGSSLWGNGTYSYDSMGNVTALSLGTSRNASFSYAAPTPRLTSVTENGTPSTVGHDAAGNEINAGPATYSYSSRNFLQRAGTMEFAYDGRGVRTVTVQTFAIATLSADVVAITGGTPVTATVTLASPAPAGGATVTLSSSDPSATVPASVVIPSGSVSGTFTVVTLPVAADAAATITASANGSSQSLTISIKAPALTAAEVVPQAVIGGNSATGSVALSGPAPSAGLTVALVAAGSAAASLPPSVAIAGGESRGYFTVTTTPVAAPESATITATFAGVSAVTTLSIDPAELATMTIDHPVVIAGSGATGQILLDGLAPAAGATIALSSDRAEVTVPPSVTIAAGTSGAAFAIATSDAIQTQLSATIRATYGPKSVTAMLAIDPPPVTLGSVTLQPSTVVGGVSATGTVMLTRAAPPEGATVMLASSDLSIATVPASVVVPAGASAASFTISTSTTLAPAVAGITATWNGVSQTAILTVNPPSTLSIYSLTVDPRNVAGGGGATGTVVLTGPAPNGGVDVTLTSSDPATVTVPVRVRVKGGDTTASFAITTRAVTSTTAVTISGQYGQLSQSDVLTVIPPTAIRLLSVTLSPATVIGGSPVTGTVTIDTPAPAGGIAVTLSSKQKKLVTLPGTVLVPDNATTGTFTIATQTVRRSDTAEIRASFAGVTRSATLTVTPPAAALMQRWRTWRTQTMARHAAPAPPLSLSVTAPMIAALPAGAPRRISLYSPELQLMVETETSTAGTPPIAYEYVYFAGQPLAQIETATSRIHYDFNDHLGTPLLTTDAAGAVDWRVEREPYGGRFVVRAGATIHQPLAFPGQEESSDGTPSYNIFRWYRAGWNQYTQADPMMRYFPAAYEPPYVYAQGNPGTTMDALGLYSISTIHRTIAKYPKKSMLPPVCNGQLSCTDFGTDFDKDSSLKCFCTGCGDKWRPHFTAVLAYSMYLAAESPYPNDPWHEKHEVKHIDEIIGFLGDWLESLEKQDFSEEQCNAICKASIKSFKSKVQQAASESQQHLH